MSSNGWDWVDGETGQPVEVVSVTVSSGIMNGYRQGVIVEQRYAALLDELRAYEPPWNKYSPHETSPDTGYQNPLHAYENGLADGWDIYRTEICAILARAEATK